MGGGVLKTSILTILVLSVFLSGCALFQKDQVKKRRTATDIRADRLSRLIKKQQKQINDLKIQNLVLKNKKVEKKKVKAKKYKRLSDKKTLAFYKKGVKLYYESKYNSLKLLTDRLRQTNPQSSYLDDLIYMQGRLALDQRKFPQALKLFSEVISQHPTSDKRVSAGLAKAMVYKQMGLTKYFEKELKQLTRRYPGSPEFYRAKMELKLLKTQ